MLQLFGLLSAIFTTVAYIPYFRDIFLHKTKPHRVTWLVYAVLGSIAFVAQFAKGALNSLWLPGIETLATLLILIFSVRYGIGGFSRNDKIVLGLAAAGLTVWYVTSEAAYALYLVIFIDTVGTWPTIEKAYKDHGSETLSMWVMVTVGAAFAMLAVGKLSLLLLIYPFYIFAANAAVAAAIILGGKTVK